MKQMKLMSVKEIVAEYLKRNKYDGLVCGLCSCQGVNLFCCNGGFDEDYCRVAVKRRRMVNGKRLTVLVPVEEKR